MMVGIIIKILTVRLEGMNSKIISSHQSQNGIINVTSHRISFVLESFSLPVLFQVQQVRTSSSSHPNSRTWTSIWSSGPAKCWTWTSNLRSGSSSDLVLQVLELDFGQSTPRLILCMQQDVLHLFKPLSNPRHDKDHSRHLFSISWKKMSFPSPVPSVSGILFFLNETRI